MFNGVTQAIPARCVTDSHSSHRITSSHSPLRTTEMSQSNIKDFLAGTGKKPTDTPQTPAGSSQREGSAVTTTLPAPVFGTIGHTDLPDVSTFEPLLTPTPTGMASPIKRTRSDTTGGDHERNITIDIGEDSDDDDFKDISNKRQAALIRNAIDAAVAKITAVLTKKTEEAIADSHSSFIGLEQRVNTALRKVDNHLHTLEKSLGHSPLLGTAISNTSSPAPAALTSQVAAVEQRIIAAIAAKTKPSPPIPPPKPQDKGKTQGTKSFAEVAATPVAQEKSHTDSGFQKVQSKKNRNTEKTKAPSKLLI